MHTLYGPGTTTPDGTVMVTTSAVFVIDATFAAVGVPYVDGHATVEKTTPGA